MPGKKKLLIFGHYGVPNWGDEAILAGMLRRIDLEKWDITVVSPFSEFLRKEYSISAIPPPPSGVKSLVGSFFTGTVRKSLHAIGQADFIIFGGGGLFQEEPKKALRIWNRYLRTCLFFKKKILLVGNSLGPFLSHGSLEKTAKLFQSVSYFSLRDRESVDLLRKMKIPPQRIHLATDCAFLLSQKKSSVSEKTILIALRRGDLSLEKIQEIKKLCAEWHKKKKKVEFLPMQTPQSYDELIAKHLDIPVFLPKSLAEVRAKIASAEFMLTNRLHAAILAMLSATPFVAIASRPKLGNFLKTAGLSELTLSKNWKFSELKKKTESVIKNTKVIQEKIRTAAKNERNKTNFLFPDFF